MYKEEKTCRTCRHGAIDIDRMPCSECYDSGGDLPRWEPKTDPLTSVDLRSQRVRVEHVHGAPLRERFAMAALQGLLACTSTDGVPVEDLCDQAVVIADTMLAKLRRG